MPQSSASGEDKEFLARAVDVSVRIGMLVILAVWCFQIVRPFALPVAWGVIIAVATHPIYARIEALCGGRRKLASATFVVMGLALLLLPTSVLSDTLVSTARELYESVSSRRIVVPAPPDTVASWPLVGERIHALWTQASVNLSAALAPFGPQLEALARSLLAVAAGAGLAVVQWIFAIIIAGGLLANQEAGVRTAHAISTRIAGVRGDELSDLAGATVRSVATGVVGVAIIQAVLAGLGMLLAGVPGAGLWTLMVMVMAVAQLPVILVLGPVAVYVFTGDRSTVAVVFAIWSLLVSVSDSFLKPLLLGRGSSVPTLIIFVGALGGLMSSGIIGLFVGAVVLTLGYTLATAWVDESEQPPPPAAGR